MKKKASKSSIVSSLIWKFMHSIGNQSISVIVTIILARLLSPSDFGIVALTAIFIRVSVILVQSGFNTSLIQSKSTNDFDYSSAFYLSMILSLLLYIVLFISSKYIASFYKEPSLVYILRILGLSLFFKAAFSVQSAIISRNMWFKKLFKASIFSVTISGSIGIYMAYSGYGVWSLVVQQLVSQILIVFMLFFYTSWRPKLIFSLRSIKTLFSFGSKMLLSSILDAFYEEFRGLIIGRKYSSSMLGFYNRGKKLPQQIITSVNGTIQSVLFPTLSAYQDDIPKVKLIVKRSIKTSSFIMFPLMVGMAIVAKPIVSVLLTDKWLPSVPYMQIFCASFALWPIHTTNLQAIKALGRSDVYLRLEVIKKIIGFTILIITIPFGVFYMALSVPFTGILGAALNAYPNSRLINYGIKEQFRDIAPAFFLSLFIGTSVYFISFIEISSILLLLLQLISGILIYIGLAKIFKMESLNYLIDTIKEAFQRIKTERK